MSQDAFNDFFDDENEHWNEDELTRHLKKMFWEMNREEEIEREIDLIELYYPGVDFITDAELLKQKYFPSKHFFQYVIAFKRMLEETGRGTVTEMPYGWKFISGVSL